MWNLDTILINIVFFMTYYKKAGQGGGRNFQRKEFYRFYGTHDHKPINLAQGQNTT